jgi:nifR3 family TIM-barrel protein
MSFLRDLPKPFFALAPLANVTDAAFRRVIATYGKPSVLYTEFVSADGLVRGNREVLKRDLQFTDAERPIVAQFFTSTPKHMEEAARLARELGFDGIDINMGCPDRSVEKQGAGAAHIRDPERAQEIIAAAKEGAHSLPVSVKTRIGYHKDTLEEWMEKLLDAKPAAITIHARTRKELSEVPAQWGAVTRAVELARGSGILVIGNGDVRDLAEARARAQETGADGIMLGRAIFGNPWLFAERVPTREEKLAVLVEHAKLFEELLLDVKNFSIMKKHFKSYVEGFPGAKELRVALMETNYAQEVAEKVALFLRVDAVVSPLYTLR